MCWYDPPEEKKRLIKDLCEKIVDEIKLAEKEGNPMGMDIKDVVQLLNHLYCPEYCEERNERFSIPKT